MSVATQGSIAIAEPITKPSRSNTVDIMKGIAISLMTYGHTMQGMAPHGWWGGPKFLFNESFIYSFHMPVFFFTAGLFVMRSLERRGVKNFVKEKLKTILYPYVLWAILYAVLEPFITRFKNTHHPFELKDFLVTLFDGNQGWFLYALFGCLMVAVLTRKWPVWARLALGVVAGVLIMDWTPAIGMIAHEFCFMAVGMWVGTRFELLSARSAVQTITGFLAVMVFQAAMIFKFGHLTQWSYIPLGLTGTAGVAMLSQAIEPTRVGDFFGWLGRASLGIFLIAAFVQGAARELLLRVAHTDEFWLQLLVPTVASTLIPAIIWYQQDRLRIRWLFSWPGGKSSIGLSDARQRA
jgi:fucose 4-O-acetylase-like acetyltransferase